MLIIVVIVLHNHLVRLRARCDQAWAQVDAQLQRRHDLVPNLVATVRGYAGHERAALDAVTAARQAALAVRDPLARGHAEGELGRAIGQLLLLTEAYPRLRADERFRHLQEELTGTEDRIAFARGFANDRVARCRAAITTIPTNLVARLFGFEDRPLYAADPTALTAPTVPPEVPRADRSP